ncbi:MAG: fumarate reductase subunit C [Rhodocyclaceae bacterium]|nr:fumarate reductase subunit C [Rhodocyclaceae bacterium]
MKPRAIGKRRPYVRPMAGWWRRNPFFVEYMIHEGTAFFVAAYALVLLVGVVRLAQGEAAWNGWLQALHSPVAIAFHLLVLVAMVYHSWTWFNIMPRTLPPIFVAGKRLSATAITSGGLAATAFASAVLLLVVWRLST